MADLTDDTVRVPITLNDLIRFIDVIDKNEQVSWTFPNRDGQDVHIHFVSKSEYDSEETEK